MEVAQFAGQTHRPGWTELTSEIRIVVPGDNAMLSPNNRSRINRWERARLVKVVKARAAAAWALAGRPVYDGPFPVTIRTTIRRARALDDDGAVGSIKALRDGLFGAETRSGLARMGLIIPDDSLRYARFETPVQETGKRFAGREEVEFFIVGENR